jgi:hypothetical protein
MMGSLCRMHGSRCVENAHILKLARYVAQKSWLCENCSILHSKGLLQPSWMLWIPCPSSGNCDPHKQISKMALNLIFSIFVFNQVSLGWHNGPAGNIQASVTNPLAASSPEVWLVPTGHGRQVEGRANTMTGRSRGKKGSRSLWDPLLRWIPSENV